VTRRWVGRGRAKVMRFLETIDSLNSSSMACYNLNIISRTILFSFDNQCTVLTILIRDFSWREVVDVAHGKYRPV
jgi:hypothetical protein